MNELLIKKHLEKNLNKFQKNLFISENIDIKEFLKDIDRETLKNLYFYSLSDSNKKFEDILYLINYIRYQKPTIKDFIRDSVLERIFTIAQKVRREIHRFKGFLRFKEIKGKYLYAPFSPDYNIILHLAKYFSFRLKNEKIILHDTKRKLAVFCYKNRIYSAKIHDKIPSETSIEKLISELWIEYFEKISIKERTNIKLQKQKVPIKYRKFLIEFKGEL